MTNKMGKVLFLAFLVITGFIFLGCNNGLIDDVISNSTEILDDSNLRYPVGTIVYDRTVNNVRGVLQQTGTSTLRFTFDNNSNVMKTVTFRVEIYTSTGILNTIRNGTLSLGPRVSQYDPMSIPSNGTALVTNFTVAP